MCLCCSTAYYGEYKCFGAGAEASRRVPWSHQLSDEEAQPFLQLRYINGETWLGETWLGDQGCPMQHHQSSHANSSVQNLLLISLLHLHLHLHSASSSLSSSWFFISTCILHSSSVVMILAPSPACTADWLLPGQLSSAPALMPPELINYCNLSRPSLWYSFRREDLSNLLAQLLLLLLLSSAWVLLTVLLLQLQLWWPSLASNSALPNSYTRSRLRLWPPSPPPSSSQASFLPYQHYSCCLLLVLLPLLFYLP